MQHERGKNTPFLFPASHCTTQLLQVQEKERRTEITGLKYRKSQSHSRAAHLFFEARQILQQILRL